MCIGTLSTLNRSINLCEFMAWLYSSLMRPYFYSSGRAEWHPVVGATWSHLYDQLRVGSVTNLAVLWQFDRIYATVSRYVTRVFGLSKWQLIKWVLTATKWGQGEWEPDLFDCRLRPWYLQAAASPKDMIILVDTSGSMTGVRKEIAKHVVLTLLDTLSENDFINIYKFSEVPVPVVPCFKDKVVQVQGNNYIIRLNKRSQFNWVT
jgi:hypothetical protein